MASHGGGRDHQGLRDLRVARALRQLLQHLHLAGGEAVGVGRGGIIGPPEHSVHALGPVDPRQDDVLSPVKAKLPAARGGQRLHAAGDQDLLRRRRDSDAGRQGHVRAEELVVLWGDLAGM